MPTENEKWLSILIVPEDGSVMKKWRITSRQYTLLKGAGIAVCCFFVAGFVAMISLGVMYGRLQHYKKLNAQFSQAAMKIESIAVQLERYKEKERKLRTLLGGDLELPKPMVIEPESPTSRQASTPAKRGTDELEQATLSLKARLRSSPTLWPVEPWQITKEYRNTGKPREDHYGIDILAPANSSVVASADGIVTFAGEDQEYGLMVIISHGNGWETRYGHTKSLIVAYGDSVMKGQQIAVYGGNDPGSTSAHLHMELRYKGQPVNPLDKLERKPLLSLTKNLENK